MIPGLLTQSAAAIFTLWFLGAVPLAALAQAILQPCSSGLQLDRASHYRTAANQKHAVPLTPSSTSHLLLSLSVSVAMAREAS